jgi:hypothetical protein
MCAARAVCCLSTSNLVCCVWAGRKIACLGRQEDSVTGSESQYAGARDNRHRQKEVRF